MSLRRGGAGTIGEKEAGASSLAARLRSEFDLSFSLPARVYGGGARNFIVLEVAGERYALATAELRSLERPVQREAAAAAARGNENEDTFVLRGTARAPAAPTAGLEVVRVPSSQPALLGLRSFNGRIVPVFSLGTLLGVGSPGEPTHCALVMAGKDEIALAFDALLRLVRVEAAQIFAAGSSAQRWQQETLSDGGEVLPVISVAALIEQLQRTAGQPQITNQTQDGTR